MTELPEKLEYLGLTALPRDCAFPDGLEVPETLTTIKPGAFRNVEISEFRLSSETESRLSVIDGMLFSQDGKTLLQAVMPKDGKKLVIPEGTETVGAYACADLLIKELVIPGSVRVIEDYAFDSNWFLTYLTIEDGLERIGAYNFTGARMTALELPESCSFIGDYSFSSCPELESVSIHAVSVGEDAFKGCHSLWQADFGEQLSEIGARAFADTRVDPEALPDSVRIIREKAFSRSSDQIPHDREELIFRLPAELHTLEEGVFASRRITDYEVPEENRTFSAVDGLLTDKAEYCLLLCPPMREGTVEIPDGIEEISDKAFLYSPRVTNVIIPDSVHLIREEALMNNPQNTYPYEKIPIHCGKGSAAESFAVQNDWPYSIDW